MSPVRWLRAVAVVGATALLMALFQTALVFFAGRVLDVTTLQAARYILTGQAQNANYTQANFATYVCNNTFALFNCNNFMINVQTYSTWASSTCTARASRMRRPSWTSAVSGARWTPRSTTPGASNGGAHRCRSTPATACRAWPGCAATGPTFGTRRAGSWRPRTIASCASPAKLSLRWVRSPQGPTPSDRRR